MTFNPIGLLDLFFGESEKQKRESYLRGYDYAAGVMLRGEQNPIEVRDMVYVHSLSPGHPFDKGMIDASHAFENILNTIGIGG